MSASSDSGAGIGTLLFVLAVLYVICHILPFILISIAIVVTVLLLIGGFSLIFGKH